MSGEPTILGCPVVNGRAETPLGVVWVLKAGERGPGYWTWELDVASGHVGLLRSGGLVWDTPEGAAGDADRVLRALYVVGRVAGLREAAALSDALAVQQDELTGGQLRRMAAEAERGEP